MSKDMRDPTRANVGFAANMFNSSHTEPWVLLAFPIARWMLTSDCPSFDLCLDFLPLVGKQGRCGALVLLHDFVLQEFVAIKAFGCEMRDGQLNIFCFTSGPLDHLLMKGIFGEPEQLQESLSVLS